MAKRDKGIREYQTAKGTRYEVVVDLGPDPATGKRWQRSKSFVTKREAEQARRAWMVEIDKGEAVDTSRKTLGDVLQDWLEAHAANKPCDPPRPRGTGAR